MAPLISLLIGSLITGITTTTWAPAKEFFAQTVPYIDAATALASTGNFATGTCAIAAEPSVSPYPGAPVALTFTTSNTFLTMTFGGDVVTQGQRVVMNPTEKTNYVVYLDGTPSCQYTIDIAPPSTATVCSMTTDIGEGSGTDAVGALQQVLIDTGYPLVKSGVYDVRTKAAVKLLQLEHVVAGTNYAAVTGVWDERTRTEMQHAYACGDTKASQPVANTQQANENAPVQAAPETGKVCLDKFIRPRAQGDEVNALQQFLQKQGFVLDATGFYGEKTKQAVKDFQEAFADDILKPNDLTAGNGIWGPSTAKKASALGLCGFVK